MLLGDMAAACERIGRAIAAGERICVHGDYDADGICATALAVPALRELGANVEWHVPSRFDEGYGLAAETVERLAGDGVAPADHGRLRHHRGRPGAPAPRQLGMDVIVTDHHRPGDALPDCPLVCTRPSDYPFPELSGTGVVFKLAQALYAQAGRDPAALEQHLDLVALATIADVVPLQSTRTAAWSAPACAGLRAPTRPGLRALMAAARVDRARVGASDVGFRLAPRINAAGRLCHPGEALELLLTDDERAGARARDPARGAEPRAADGRGRDPARRARPDRGRAAPSGGSGGPTCSRRRDWHEGVVGIVASRLVERCGRPVVLIAVNGDEAKGSGRSIPAYDLHAGLTACRRASAALRRPPGRRRA